MLVNRLLTACLLMVFLSATAQSTGYLQVSTIQLGGLTGLQPTGLDAHPEAHWRIARISQVNGDKTTTYINARSGYPWTTVWNNDTKDVYTVDEIDKLFVQRPKLDDMLSAHDDALQKKMLNQLNNAVVGKYMTNSQAQQIEAQVRRELTQKFQKEIEELTTQINTLREGVGKCRGQ